MSTDVEENERRVKLFQNGRIIVLKVYRTNGHEVEAMCSGREEIAKEKANCQRDVLFRNCNSSKMKAKSTNGIIAWYWPCSLAL